MVRTFIGELILRLKDEMSGKAKQAAANLDTSVDRIHRAAQKLNQTSWGGQFEQRLHKLGASATEIDKLRHAWDKLNTSITSRNLGAALAGAERSNFKTATLSHFSQIASQAETADSKVKGLIISLKDVAKYSAAAGIVYGGINAVRGGINASAEYQREVFRQENANIPRVEQLKIAAEADRLTSLYPSAGLVNVMEMARQARNMMGDTDRGLAILPQLVKGLVALQTAKGTDAAPDELSQLLRGIDNAGKNVGGDLGIQQTRDVIAGLVRASQIEGRELDVGQMWAFMRRAKIAGPGFSTEFLANVAPALIQDMTAPGAGTALSSAFQAFVIGSNAVASKKNILEQERLGIRKNGKLVNSQLMGENPYQWVKEVLLPALQKDGVDIDNDTALAEAIAKMSRNTPAASMLTKMLQQREQMDRLIEQYKAAAGPDAAEEARFKDPFVAWKGFIESLRNLAAAVGEDTMPTIVAGLNGLANGINALQQAWRDGDPMAKLGITGAAVGAGYGAWKLASAVWGLITAGTNLNAAAASLELAAASLAGAGKSNLVDQAVESGKKNGGWLAAVGGLFQAVRAAALLAVPAVAADSVATNPGSTMDEMRDNQYRYANDLRRLLGLDPVARRNTSGSPDDRDDRRRAIDPYTSATDYMRRRQAFEADAGQRGNTPGLGDIFKPQVDMGDVSAAAAEASTAGQQIQSALSVSATPMVNTAQLREAVALANQLKSALAGIGSAVQQASSSVFRRMNRNFTDQGVTP